ncbi:hypothetical protein [Lentzea sp. CC55]|uniref:hypothetical protein n=1 Tax=Lentzea sp. CC55 TaxID=2884909 RepID=UPI001F264833|nr:hypothetical protein [Lentzea sp. CC55]MCG8923242.1 hypothetical protein [Lentzea sp. CC55]
MDQHDLSWADAGPGPFLDEIFTLVFVRDLDPPEALRRAGGLTAARRGDPVVLTPESDLGRHVREWPAPTGHP